MRCLIVIDMQHRFEASQQEWLQENIALKIQEFIACDEPIIFVEYSEHIYKDGKDSGVRIDDPTYQLLHAAAKDYTLLRTVFKDYNDGSCEIIRCMNEERWNPDIIQICGVNLDACVEETVIGLIDFLPEKEYLVLEDCCASHNNWEESICHFEFETGEHDNIRLVMAESVIATHYKVHPISQPKKKVFLLDDIYEKTSKVEGVLT